MSANLRKIRVLAYTVVLLFLAASGGHAMRTAPLSLLQYTAGGHVLGFGPGKMWVGTQTHMLQVELVGARQEMPSTNSTGTQEQNPKTKAQPMQTVAYQNAWPGVTVEYAAANGAIAESTYRIRAGLSGDPVARIRLRYNRPVRLDDAGNLKIKYEQGEMCETAPKAWQERGGVRRQVPVRFRVIGEREVGFVAEYDSRYPLVIDPTLIWNTFLVAASGYSNLNNSIAVDGNGNVYVGGTSNTTWGTPVRVFSGGYETFVTKLTSSGSVMWSTFLGGSGLDLGCSIAVDTSGNVYVGGVSGASWGTPVRALTGEKDVFVAKLTSSGSLIWNTFLGGATTDQCNSIVVDGSGNVYVGGNSDATWGSPVQPFSGSSDAFAAKLTSNGNLVWNTFMGGSGAESCQSIAVDGNENVYMAVTKNTGLSYVFATKLSSNGSLLWNTGLGGTGGDSAFAIAVDGAGNVYVGGYSGGGTWGTPVRAYSGYDAFAAKLNSSGTLVWNTFLGGGGTDFGYSIAVDGSGNVYVGGYSTTTWGAPARSFSGANDAFAAKLNSSGGLMWNMFFGGTGYDYGTSIAVNGTGSVYMAGYSYNGAWGTPVRAYSGIYDVFGVKIFQDPMFGSITPPNALTNSNAKLTIRGKMFSNVTSVQLKNANQTVNGTIPNIINDTKFTAQFNLPATPGLFDLVVNESGIVHTFKSVFTSRPSVTPPVLWQQPVNMGQAGSPATPGSSAIAIVDADRDNQSEVYVVDNEHMPVMFKKSSIWTTGFLPETPADYFRDLLPIYENSDGGWELYGATSKPEIRQIQYNGTSWSSKSVGDYSGPLAVGDCANGGLKELYATSGNSTNANIAQVSSGSVVGSSLGTVFCLLAGDGDNDQVDELYAANSDKRVFQFKYNGAGWDKSIVAIVGTGDMKKLALGDVDKDGKNELYGANLDKNVYQFKLNGSTWESKSIGVLPGACQAVAVGDGDNDGNDEIYAACDNGHAYQLRLDGSVPLDLGDAGTPLTAITVGDGGVYAVGANAHVFQFQAISTHPPVPTPVPAAKQQVKVYNSQINPDRGEQARIRWYQPNSSPVNIRIYNLIGDEVITLQSNAAYAPGVIYEVPWSGKNKYGQTVASGIYIVDVKAGGSESYSKIAVVR